ncbi:hypothetical protein AAMO2058_000080600 [Amorphochlora amoebiformis]
MFIERANGCPFTENSPETCHAVYLKGVHVIETGLTLPNPHNLPIIKDGSLARVGDSDQKLDKSRKPKINANLKPLTFLPSNSYYELPSCPVCIERLDSAVSGLLMPYFVPDTPAEPSHLKKRSGWSRWESLQCTVCDTVALFTQQDLKSAKDSQKSRGNLQESSGSLQKSSGNLPESNSAQKSPGNLQAPQAREEKKRDSATSVAGVIGDLASPSYPPLSRKAALRAANAAGKLRLNCTECERESDLKPRQEGGEHRPGGESTIARREPPWICLVCGHIGCGRFQQSHAVRHFETTGHRFSLFLKSEAIWDYEGDGYVHRLLRHKTNGFARRYTLTIEVGEGSALTGVKLKAISGHYNHLLTVLLTKQQHHYLLELSKEHSRSKQARKQLSTEEAKLQHLKDSIQKGEKVIRGLNKKIATLQGKISKESSRVEFLKDLNDTLIKGQTKTKPTNKASLTRVDVKVAECDRRVAVLEKEVEKLMKELDD